MNKNITKNQHYIPQFFQKQWDIKEKKLLCWNLNFKKITKVSIKNNCSKLFLYEYNPNNPNNFFEVELAKKESLFSQKIMPQIPLIESGIKTKFNEEEKDEIMEFIVQIINRHPVELENIEEKIKHSSLNTRLSKALEEKIFSRTYMLFPKLSEKLKYLKNTHCLISITAKEAKNSICFSDRILFIDFGYSILCFFPLSPNILLTFSNKIVNFNSEIIINIYNKLLFMGVNKINKVYSKREDIIKLFAEKQLY